MDNKNLGILKPDVVLFTSQISLVFVVVCVSLINLTLQWDHKDVWVMILTSSLAFIMPNPRLKAANRPVSLTDSTSTSSERL